MQLVEMRVCKVYIRVASDLHCLSLSMLQVDYYGAPTPLKSLAGISAPESTMLVVQPYDKTAMQAIEKAIMQSDIGATPSNDGNLIRINIPALTAVSQQCLSHVCNHGAHVLSFATHLDYADINMARVSLTSHVASCHTCCSFLLLSAGYHARQATKEVVGEASDILQVLIKSMLTTPVYTSHAHFVCRTEEKR